jgi:hypothetical protein
MMKLKIAGAFIAPGTLFYLFVLFVWLEPNMMSWEPASRLVFTILALYFGAVLYAFGDFSGWFK